MSINPPTLTLSKELSLQSDFIGLKNLEERMHRALIGQPEAVNCVAEMIKRVKTGFYDEAKPRGVLVFAGPTGVGKTELAKITAYEMGVPLHRFDMSEFSESHKVSRLLGSPAGYVDSNRGGELVNKLMRTPACVVLFDEIEKAHSDVYKIFLQLFDEGRLTDSMGQEVNASQAIFILTTNLGSHEIYQEMQRGVRDNLDERLKALCIRTFSAELYNRFDKVVVFRHLTKSAMEKIVEKYLSSLKDSFARRKLDFIWDQQVVVHLSALQVDVNMGARDIHRKIKEHILPKLSDGRIHGRFLQTGVRVCMKVVDGNLELAVLDKGKEIVVSQLEHVPTVTKETQKEAVILKDRVVYLDLTGRSLQNLEGLHVFRLGIKGRDRSYTNNCIKIVHISSIGEIVYEDNDRFLKKEGKLHFMSSLWNDGEWGPITPARNGRAFFENVCTVIDNPSLQQQTLSLIQNIFSRLEDDCHLSENAPFDSLKEYCIKGNKEDLLKEIETLERLLGSFSVIILSKKPMQDPDDPLRSKL